MSANPPIPFDYSRTPTPLPPSPRRVCERIRQRLFRWVVRIFILPHAIIGLVLIHLLVSVWMQTPRPYGTFFVMAIITAIWNGVVLLAVYSLWVTPFRRRAIYRGGEATVGTVVSKREVAGKYGARFCYLKYRFHDSFSGKAFEGETDASVAAYDRAAAGQEVTVLYDKDRPKRSAVYEFGEFTVEPMPVAHEVR